MVKSSKKKISSLKNFYKAKKSELKERLHNFKKIGRESNEKIFTELCFCLCTPQSNAKACWEAVSILAENKKLYEGNVKEISKILKKSGVRFHNNKARYITEARKFFSKDKIKNFNDSKKTRDFLVKNVKGLGYKEASHFLRNISLGKDLAILDRHILKNLLELEVIKEVPKSISGKKYLEIESKMQKFSKEVGIPMNELDLILWAKETGRIFK